MNESIKNYHDFCNSVTLLPDGTVLLFHYFHQLISHRHLGFELVLELSDLKFIINTHEGPEDPKGETNGAQYRLNRSGVARIYDKFSFCG